MTHAPHSPLVSVASMDVYHRQRNSEQLHLHLAVLLVDC